MTTTYRIQPADRPISDLLDDTTWQSRVWSGEQLKTCPACNGCGYIVDHIDDDGDAVEDDCDTCNTSGEVEDVRYGVSACHTMADLYQYFGRRMDTDTQTEDLLAGTVLVEMDAAIAGEDDHDVREGLAVLVWPRAIISVRPFDVAEIPAEDIRRNQY